MEGVQAYWTKTRTNRLASFAQTLQQMDEPVYWDAADIETSGTMYRFVWLRTFHNPVSITIELPFEGEVCLTQKVFDGKAGFNIGNIKAQRILHVERAKLKQLISELQGRFWSAPEFDGLLGCDGATWMIEGIENGRHHLAHRWSPESGWVHDVGLMFLNAAELKPEKIY